jgi:hypothetical protein
LPADDEATVKGARRAREKFAEALKSRANVTGLGVGYKVVAGRRTGQVAVRVYVSRKLPPAQLSPHDLVPPLLDGVPTDVIEAHFKTQQGPPPISEHRRRRSPLMGGISVGNLRLGGSGTLGVSVYDDVSREDMILSNWHVLCGRDQCAVGEVVIQPGTGDADVGGPSDGVGTLWRAVLSDRVDAALARLNGRRFLLRDVLGIGLVTELGTPRLGLRVRKSGRTTGVTTGFITDDDAEVDVTGYPGGTRTFRHQIIIEDGLLSAPGDSGSVWVDDADRAVALLFAGSDVLAAANPLRRVFLELKCNLASGVAQQDFIAITHSTLF